MTRPNLIDLSPIEIDYYLLKNRHDKCNGSCNDVDKLSTKICVLSKRKDVNV